MNDTTQPGQAASSANRKALISASAGFVIQGSWAFYANLPFGWHKGLTAALVQGLCSFAMTYACTMLIEKVLSWLASAAPALRFAVAASASVGLILLVQGSAHWLAGTPAIVKTILPALFIGGGYCVVYSFGRVFLGRARKGQATGQSASAGTMPQARDLPAA
jgi:hypothetical protein